VSESPESPPTAEPASGRNWLFALTILFSAFLLFQVQPIIARIILPWFGGSAAVWTACMLFFQMALLLGYAYAHWVSGREPRVQAMVHVGLLAVSLAFLPIYPSDWWKPAGSDQPLLHILGLLGATIGAPYLLLSSTSPLLQAWFARHGRGGIPYRFFALSNAGSLAALVSYPVFVEPNLSSHHQAWVWSAGYAIFAIICGAVAWSTRELPLLPVVKSSARVRLGTVLIWISLPAAASAMLLAVTNHLSQNVAAIPFLWVLPLSLYLLSFILCFDSPRWYVRPLFLGLFAVAEGSMAFCLSGDGVIRSLAVLIPLFSGSLFVACMVCHGELARRKPAAGNLTYFYLLVSLGGALGGLFVAAIAPLVFPALFEFPIVIAFSALLVTGILYDQRAPKGFWADQWKVLWPASALISLALTGYVAYNAHDMVEGTVLTVRNFYGALRVTDYLKTADQDETRQLTHGTINHGEQFTDPKRRREPVTYYAPSTGIGLTIRELQKYGPVRIGVVGLGTGTLAAYGRAGDSIRFYEINPLVPKIAREQFTYLTDTPAKVEIVLGDARLSMEKEPSQHFDVLAIDAFSSDAIPVHLLTREAFQVYFRHLKPDGVLAVHVSNKYLNLAPVVKMVGNSLGKTAKLVETHSDIKTDTFASDWVMVFTRPGFAATPWLNSPDAAITSISQLRLWTDDYSNLWQILN
jgi:SAM-dependent methyltransferase